ncbi:hypothetical protein EBS80_00940 [bacterium]|nr:hypothetical protein [bacterium]
MSDPYLSRLRQELAPSRYRSRLIRELEQHIEDSGGTSETLGSTEAVATAYNRLYPVWPRAMLFFVLVFVTSVLIFCAAFLLRVDETPMESQLAQTPPGWIVGILGLAGIALSLPGIYVSQLAFFPSENFDAYFSAVPIVANLIWIIVYAVILLPSPGMIMRMLSRRLKS